MRYRAPLLLAIAAGTVLLPTPGHAQAIPVTAQVISDIITGFRTAMQGWPARLQPIAQNTFMGLATIELCWAMLKLAFKRADFSEFVAELVNQTLMIGLFLWLLLTTTVWGPAIINGFQQAAGATGAGAMSPGNVFASGIDMALAALDEISVLHPEVAIGLIICALVVVICFAWITAAMVKALVQSYFILGDGVIFMTFGAHTVSRSITISLIRTILGIGSKLFAMQMLVALGMTFVQQWAAAAGAAAITLQGLVVQIGESVVLLALVQTIPAELERMVAGSALAGAGALAGAAAELTGAAAAISLATGKLATTIAGAGHLAGAAAQLATQQIPSIGSGAGAMASRGMALLGQTARNMASGVETDIGRRLSGEGTRTGTMPFRAAADLNERARLLQEQASKATPPAAP